MTNLLNPPILAAFDSWQISRMTPQQKSDFAKQLLDNGFSRDQVETTFGLPNLTPTQAEIERKERAAYLRIHWQGDKGTLEAELQKMGL